MLRGCLPLASADVDNFPEIRGVNLLFSNNSMNWTCQETLFLEPSESSQAFTRLTSTSRCRHKLWTVAVLAKRENADVLRGVFAAFPMNGASGMF